MQVPVHVLRDPLTDDGDARTTVTLTAKSETDSSKTATRTCAVHVRDTTPGGDSPMEQGRGREAPPRSVYRGPCAEGSFSCSHRCSWPGAAADDEVAGGAGDLPRSVPTAVTFAEAPPGALAAPDFTAELPRRHAVTASELWRDRPVVLVFTASYSDRCAEIHRAAAEAVDEHEGAIGLLGIVGEDDAEGGRDYAEELDLGHPVAVAGERSGSTTPPRAGLVVLVAQGREGPARLARRRDDRAAAAAAGGARRRGEAGSWCLLLALVLAGCSVGGGDSTGRASGS